MVMVMAMAVGAGGGTLLWALLVGCALWTEVFATGAKDFFATTSAPRTQLSSPDVARQQSQLFTTKAENFSFKFAGDKTALNEEFVWYRCRRLSNESESPRDEYHQTSTEWAWRDRCLALPGDTVSQVWQHWSTVKWRNCEDFPTRGSSKELPLPKEVKSKDNRKQLFQREVKREEKDVKHEGIGMPHPDTHEKNGTSGSDERARTRTSAHERSVAMRSPGVLMCFVCRSDVNEECSNIGKPPSPGENKYLMACGKKDEVGGVCRIISQKVGSSKLLVRECGKEAASEKGGCYRNHYATQEICECFTSACNAARRRTTSQIELSLTISLWLKLGSLTMWS